MFTSINKTQLLYLRRIGMNLNHLFYLDKSIIGVLPDTSKEWKLLISRFLVDDTGHITETGMKVYQAVINAQEGPLQKIKLKSIVPQSPVEEQFKAFYNIYPASNKFTYKGVVFDPVKKGDKKRGLRDDYNKCLIQFTNLCRNTDTKPEVYVKAIEVEVECLKQKSYVTGNNHISYVPGMSVWLGNSRYYNTYVGEELQEETAYSAEESNCG